MLGANTPAAGGRERKESNWRVSKGLMAPPAPVVDFGCGSKRMSGARSIRKQVEACMAVDHVLSAPRALDPVMGMAATWCRVEIV